MASGTAWKISVLTGRGEAVGFGCKGWCFFMFMGIGL